MYYLVFEVSRELQEAALVVQALIQGQFPFSLLRGLAPTVALVDRVHELRCIPLQLTMLSIFKE